MTFRFVGSELQISHVALKTFGQAIDLEPAMAQEIIAHEHSAALLPDELFAALGFTSDELRGGNSETFGAKRAQAWALLAEQRVRLRAGGAFEKETE